MNIGQQFAGKMGGGEGEWSGCMMNTCENIKEQN